METIKKRGKSRKSAMSYTHIETGSSMFSGTIYAYDKPIF